MEIQQEPLLSGMLLEMVGLYDVELSDARQSLLDKSAVIEFGKKSSNG